MTIHGLGGCRKSALALELAYRVLAKRAEYPVFWIPAVSRERFELAFRQIGTALRLPGVEEENANVMQLVKATLSSESSSKWLIIVDNADDPDIILRSLDDDSKTNPLVEYLPFCAKGTILFTTRNRKAAEDLSQDQATHLSDMDQADAEGLLARRLSDDTKLTRESDATAELLRLLAYLPLAIVQAAAFINSNDVSISQYVSLFSGSDKGMSLFSEHFEDSRRYREAESMIAKTWYISFEQKRK